MSQQAARTKALKEIFEAAKKAPKENGFIKELELSYDLDDALFAVGKERIYELKNEVFYFLDEENSYFRKKAIRVLGYDNGDGLNLPEMKDISYDFWLNDPDDSVKAAALDEWSRYYSFSKDPEVLQYLYNIFYSQQYSSEVKMQALLNFMIVAADISNVEVDEIYDLCQIEDGKLFFEAMESKFSEKINNIMKKYVSNRV